MAACTLFVPVDFFPSRQQLMPFAPGGYVEVSDFDQTAEVKWKELTVKLEAVGRGDLPELIEALFQAAKSHGGNQALAMRIFHSLGAYRCEVTPDFDDEGRAMRVISGIVDASDGLLHFDGELFGPGGQALLLGGEPLLPPPAERVRDRALALLALSMRGLLEQDAGKPDQPKAEAMRAQLFDWAEERLKGELEEVELQLLAAPLGAPPAQLIVDAVWRAEGAQVLLWALSARALPAHDAQEHPYVVARESGVMATMPKALQSPRLRPLAELEAMQRTLMGVHWRVREAKQQPKKPVDLPAFARSAWFGAFELPAGALLGGDLSVKGKSITQSSEADLGLVRSIAHERHLAANWVLGVNPSYVRVNTPT